MGIFVPENQLLCPKARLVYAPHRTQGIASSATPSTAHATGSFGLIQFSPIIFQAVAKLRLHCPVFAGHDVQLGKPVPRKTNIDPCSVKNLLRWRDRRCQVGVLCETGYEEHEPARLDLHLGKVGMRWR